MAVRLSEVKVVSEFGRRLIEWLDCKFFGLGQRVHVICNNEERFTIRIYTSKHSYQIVATKDYLGCTTSTRMSRPGENWTRGNDLPDGRFSKETLYCILCSIVFYEAREVVKDIEQIEDTVEGEIKT